MQEVIRPDEIQLQKSHGGRGRAPLPRIGISGCIIACNEGDRIGDCIASLDFCDEVLVVDSGSDDETRSVAYMHGARVITRDWTGYAAQKDFAIRSAVHDWVLCLDADERVSKGLRGEIMAFRALGVPDVNGYHMPRLSEYFGRWIRHGAWYPNRQLRLFDRRQGHWGGPEPHDRVILEGPVGKLRNDLLHVPYRSLQEQRKTIQVYTSIAARELADRGCSFAPLRMLFNPGWRVFRSLVLKAGFLAGWRGFMLAGMEARYAYLKYRKLMQLRKEACPDLSTGEKVAVGDHPLPALPPLCLAAGDVGSLP